MPEQYGPSEYYYHSNIKRQTIAFMDIFNEFKVRRWDKDGNVEKEIRVPIIFGSIERATYKNKEGKTVNRMISLPMIHIDMPEFSIDKDRTFAMKSNKFAYIFSKNPDPQYYYDYMSLLPYPYNFTYTVTILGKYIEDLMQLTEQIVPLFNYHRALKYEHPVYEDIDLSTWVSISNYPNFDFNQSYSAEDRRDILAVPITFKVEGWLQREIYPNNYNVINQIIVNYVVANQRVLEERITGDPKIQIMVYNYTNEGLFQEGDILTGSKSGYTATVLNAGQQFKKERYKVTSTVAPNTINLQNDPGWELGQKFVLVGDGQTLKETPFEVITNTNGTLTTNLNTVLTSADNDTYVYDYNSWYYDQSADDEYQNFTIIEFNNDNETYIKGETISVSGVNKTIVVDCKSYKAQDLSQEYTDHPPDEDGIYPNPGTIIFE